MFNPAISKLTAPPVSVVQDWRASYDGRLGELIDMSQAVPGYAAHPEMTAALEKAAAQQEHEGWAYFFCSNACHELFRAAPERYSSSRRQVPPAQIDKEP